MRISVIIPCYNQGEFLADAIESALDQTAPPEVIVINDGSTDNSLDIAKSYESRGVKVVNQVNKGLPSARNTGIMHATGDYILPLDADDCLLENCIEKIAEEIKVHQSDVVAPSFKCFGVADQEVILTGIPSLKEFVQANRLGYFSAIKKSVLLEVGGYNPKMVWGYEDWDLWLDIFKRGHSLSVLQDVLVLYRTKKSSMLTEANKRADELKAQMIRNHHDLYDSLA